MRAQFIRGNDPKRAIGLGKDRFDQMLQELKDKVGNKGTYTKDYYTKEEDFEDDNFIVYLFKKVYDRWKEKSSSINPEDIAIWSDRTSGGTDIIKISGPGVRETTLLRGETEYYGLVSKDIIDLLQSPEIKAKFAKRFSKTNSDVNKLQNMILADAKRKGITMGSWMPAENIANRLIKILK